MKIIIPKSEKISQIILVIEPINTNQEIFDNFFHLPKFILKKYGLKYNSEKNCEEFFKSKNFLKFLIERYKTFVQDRDNAIKNGLKDFSFQHLENQIARIITSFQKEDKLKIVFLPDSTEIFSFKTLTIDNRIINVNINIEEGPYFSKGQKFPNAFLEDNKKNKFVEQIFKYGNFIYSFIDNVRNIKEDNNKINNDEKNL